MGGRPERYRDNVNRDAVIGWAVRHPLTTDAGVGVVLTALGTAAALYGPQATTHHFSATSAVFAVISVGVVTLRRRAPLEALAVIAAATVLALSLGVAGSVTGAGLVVAAWTVAVHRPRRTSMVACGLVAGALFVRALLAHGFSGLRAENLNVVILTLLATAIGIAVRDRRAYLAALVERAERAEQTRESEAARRVAEERLRIARDLHDSLAHHMAVVNVQTGVAQHLLTSDPVTAGQALGHARQAAGQVLDELGTVLGVLRSTGDGETTEPAPSLSRLSDLIDPLRAAGLDVRTTASGRPRELTPAVDQAAYRLVQEALTNVQKHAPGSRVTVGLGFGDNTLTVEVIDSGASSPADGPAAPGFGLAGMRERCAAVGGRLSTGPTLGGGFRVLGVLPVLDGPPPLTVGSRGVVAP